MIRINDPLNNKNDALALVDEAEKHFSDELSFIASEIAADRRVKCISLSGPSCSGKTTAASKLTTMLSQRGIKSRVISVDDFYYDKYERKAKNLTDIEGPDSINFPMFRSVIDDLVHSRPTLFPTFDFPTQTRSCFTEYTPHGNDLYIFEGIQAIYPNVIEVISKLGYKRLYISVAEDAEIYGKYFSKNEIRLLRRIVRDNRERALSPAQTMSHWHVVRENEEKNIFPFVHGSDYVVNSMMSYELFLISKVFLHLTDSYRPTDSEADVIYSLRERLYPLTDTAVDISMIPFDSVFREFIG